MRPRVDAAQHPRFDRGYTGHEHLCAHGLINMNGRLYDPTLQRFLSPDPYVQQPGNSQSYNRYSYCLNNPLKYTDPDGHFFVGYTFGFFRGLFTGKNPFKEGWKTGLNELKTYGGLFASDPNKSTGGRVWEIVSRFTWQLPQTIGGFTSAYWTNNLTQVNWVKYKYGATVLQTNGQWGGITQGSYIIGDRDIEADANNPLFQHEYGHYIQGQSMGWAYYLRVGITSLLSKGDHNFHPAEQDANRRAFLYFNKNIDGFYDVNRSDNKGWDFFENPLDINGKKSYRQLVDYKKPAHLLALDKLTLRAKWYDHASWLLLPIGGPVWVGLINAGHYNNE